MSRTRIAAASALAVVAGLLSPLGAAPANALPPKCSEVVTWHDGTTSQRDDGTLVETGIFGTSRTVCGPAVDPPGDDGAGDGGWSDPPSGPPSPPTVPGAPLPKPPASVPPKAGPPCLPGSNNVARPGADPSATTGDGEILLANLDEAMRNGDLVIEYSSGAAIGVSLNLGESTAGGGASNPYEGLSPEDAAQALYWPDGFDPTYTEIGKYRAAADLVKTAVKYAMKGARGNGQSRTAFQNMLRVLDNALLKDVVAGLRAKIDELNKVYRVTESPELRRVILILWEEVEGAAEMVIDIGDSPAPAVDPALAYIAATSAATPDNPAGHSNGVCGQIKQAVASTASSVRGVLPTGTWAQIAWAGTAHGTLIPKIAAMTAPALRCPLAEVQGVIGAQSVVNVTEGCVGTVSSARLLTRKETAELPPAERNALLASAAADPLATSVFDYERGPEAGTDGHLPPGHATSVAGTDRTRFFGDSSHGDLDYTGVRKVGVDYLVVAAKDPSGDEHPFIVKMTLADPASCDRTTNRDVGRGPDGFVTRLKGDLLHVERGTPFTIDPQLLCTTDFRHSYQVVIDQYSDALRPRVNADGTITFEWIDTGVVGTNQNGMRVTAWDEVTGAPGKPVDILLDVKDVPYECNDVEIDYDWSELKGAPLEVPISCSMRGGLAQLSAPYFRFAEGSVNDGYDATVAGGTVSSDGSTVTFTPSTDRVELSTVHVDVWNRDPLGSLGRDPKPYYETVLVHSAGVFVDIRFSD